MQTDADVLLAVNGLHSSFFDTFMFLCSDKWAWVVFYASLFYVLLRNYSLRTALMLLLFIALTIVLADQLSAHVLRPWFGRLRPANLNNPLSQWVHVVNNYRGGPYSFPSSHAANTAGLAFFCTFLFRQRWFSWMMAAWMLLVCYSRMYLGVHYPGDLIAGILLGALCAAVTFGCYCRLQQVERLSLQHVRKEPAALVHLYVPALALLLTVLAFLVCSFNFGTQITQITQMPQIISHF
jgi:undecaprenyl-diphosphatase